MAQQQQKEEKNGHTQKNQINKQTNKTETWYHCGNEYIHVLEMGIE